MPITTEEAVRRFDQWLAGQDKSAKTRTTYIGQLRRFFAMLSDVLGDDDIDPEALVPQDLIQVRDVALEQGLSASMANGLLAASKAWMACLGRRGEVVDIRSVRKQWTPRAPLHRREYNRLLRTFDSEVLPAARRYQMDILSRDKAMFVLLLSGMRAVEARNVRVRDVDVGPRTGEVRITRGKGLKQRTVSIRPEYREWLQKRIEAMHDETAEIEESEVEGAGGRAPDVMARYILGRLEWDRKQDRWVEKQMAHSTLDERVGWWCRKAGIFDVTTHTMRRTWAHMARVVDHMSLEEVALRLGHESIEITRRYTSVPVGWDDDWVRHAAGVGVGA